MQALVRCLGGAALGATLCVSLVGTVVAAETAVDCRPLGRVEQRVVDKADQGVDSLRTYVFITRGIHGHDMLELAQSLDGWRARSRCAQLAAEDAATQQRVAKGTTTF